MADQRTPRAGAVVDDTRPIDLTAVRASTPAWSPALPYPRPPEVVLVGGPLPLTDDAARRRDAGRVVRLVGHRFLQALVLAAAAGLVWVGVGLVAAVSR